MQYVELEVCFDSEVSKNVVWKHIKQSYIILVGTHLDKWRSLKSSTSSSVCRSFISFAAASTPFNMSRLMSVGCLLLLPLLTGVNIWLSASRVFASLYSLLSLIKCRACSLRADVKVRRRESTSCKTSSKIFCSQWILKILAIWAAFLFVLYLDLPPLTAASSLVKIRGSIWLIWLHYSTCRLRYKCNETSFQAHDLESHRGSSVSRSKRLQSI